MFDVRRIGAQLKNYLFASTQDRELPAETLETAVVREERRRSPRVELEMLLTATSSSGEKFQGYCRDLSREGTAALIWGDLKVGDEIELAYRPLGSEGDAIILPAVVRHVVGFRYGLEFAVQNENELANLLVETCRVVCACPA